MRRLTEVLDDLEENLLFLMLLLMVVVIFLQVVMRYAFRSSLSWSEEVGRYVFIWLTWLSTGYAVRKKRHLRIELLTDFLKPRGRAFVELIANSLWLGLGIFLVAYGWKVTALIMRRGQLTPALEFPMALAYAAVPIGAAVMCLRLFCEIVSDLRRFLTPGLEVK